jgi:hypothetical protein
MTVGNYETAGALGRPGPIGRWWRIGNGIGTGAIILWIVVNYATYARVDAPSLLGAGLITFATVAAFLNLPSTIGVGTGRDVGFWPIVIVAIPFLLAIAYNFAQYDHFWGPPLGLLSFWLMIIVFSHLALSYFAAGILAVPG